MSAESDIERDFVSLIEANRPRLLRVCRAYSRALQGAEDLYQEICFQVWRGLPNLRDRRFVDTWVYRVALNAAISFWRRGRRQLKQFPTEPARLVERADERQAGPVPADDPQVDALYRTISKLNAYEKALITLYLEDMSYEQIADLLGISANHVGVMLHRTKSKLSDMVHEVLT